jgi:hypothetical protein
MNKSDMKKLANYMAQREAVEARIKELEEKEANRIAEANAQRYQFQGEHMDSVLSDLACLTKAQFKTFITKTLLTPFAKRELAAIQAPEQQPDAKNTPQNQQNEKGSDAYGQSQNGANQLASNGNPATQKQE